MLIKSINAKDVMPVRQFSVSDLSSVVVVAGANGVGKTRLLQGVLDVLNNPRPEAPVTLQIGATSKDEREVWGKDILNTVDQSDCEKLRSILQKDSRRATWKSGVFYFESDRKIANVKPFNFTWDDIPDPDDERISWNTTFSGLSSRWQDTLHSILKKVEARRRRIAERAEILMREGKESLDLRRYQDPLAKYKDAFSQLLGPKQLLDAEARHQDLFYEFEGQKRSISTLSSGEKEVVNIVFDFITRNPQDSVIVFDEPELHLHPELSYRLIQTLKTVGDRNQFIFCTHSPDIITASLDHSVVFVAPPREGHTNQAVVAEETDETHSALKLLGQSIGIIALGKRIVLIEGESSSLDKQLYGSILKNRHPDLVLVPSEGKSVITSFSAVSEKVLSQTIWGVDFFMLCDRDAIPLSRPIEAIEEKGNGRLKVLQRYHIENYFLDEHVLASVFSEMSPEEPWLQSAEGIRGQLVAIAEENLSYAAALTVSTQLRDEVGNVTLMPKAVNGLSEDELNTRITTKATEELDRIAALLKSGNVSDVIDQEYQSLKVAIEDGETWKSLIPGRPILHKFAGKAKVPPGRLKSLYIAHAARVTSNPFEEIFEIFDGFSSVANS